MEVTNTLQSIFSQVIMDHELMIGVELTELRISLDLYKSFVDEVNSTFVSGMTFTDINEYKGVKITPVAKQGLFQLVIVVQSKMNNPKTDSDG